MLTAHPGVWTGRRGKGNLFGLRKISILLTPNNFLQKYREGADIKYTKKNIHRISKKQNHYPAAHESSSFHCPLNSADSFTTSWAAMVVVSHPHLHIKGSPGVSRVSSPVPPPHLDLQQMPGVKPLHLSDSSCPTLSPYFKCHLPQDWVGSSSIDVCGFP